MVGIVLVSHSNKIAEGTLELVSQMTSDVKIEVAAGTFDGRLGTDALMIEEKIKKVFDGDGVIVIVDLGSAVMSAEMAIENLEEDIRSKTKILDAPFVEGAIVAAMEASFSKDLEEVVAEAKKAREMTKLN